MGSLKQAYERLEEAVGKWASVSNVVACSSGTAALHLALEALRLPLGSTVIVPDFTMVAVARAVSLAGLTPVFADCEESLCISDRTIRKVRGYRSAHAIIAVHTYGRPCDMTAIHALASENGIKVIEDLAEIHGVSPHPLTHAACWSFYKNKIVGGEEGGAVSFRGSKEADLARELRCLGFTAEHNFFHTPRGHNYRLANCLAEKVLESLEMFGDSFLRRRKVEEKYNRDCPREWNQPKRVSPWVYDFRLPGIDLYTLCRIVRSLNEAGIPARHGFKPMSAQREYETREGREVDEGVNPNAYAAAREVLYVPLDRTYPGVFETVKRVLAVS